MLLDDHRETPKALPISEATSPTLSARNTNNKDDIRDNLIDSDINDLEDCSAQEYEIMKVQKSIPRKNS